jgi:hypothetical protein
MEDNRSKLQNAVMKRRFARFEVHTAVLSTIQVFWDVTPRWLVNSCLILWRGAASPSSSSKSHARKYAYITQIINNRGCEPVVALRNGWGVCGTPRNVKWCRPVKKFTWHSRVVSCEMKKWSDGAATSYHAIFKVLTVMFQMCHCHWFSGSWHLEGSQNIRNVRSC